MLSQVPGAPPECNPRHLTLDWPHISTMLRFLLDAFGFTCYRIHVTNLTVGSLDHG